MRGRGELSRIPALLAATGAFALGCSAGSLAGGSASAVKLTAVELAPEDPLPGGQFVRVRNSGEKAAAIGCWRLRSRATGLTLYVEYGARLPAGRVAQLSGARAWLKAADRVTLLDAAGRVVARTPSLSDMAFDDRLWFRTAAGEWRFGRTTSNRKAIAVQLLGARPAAC